MAAKTPPRRTAASRLAAIERHHPNDATAIAAAREQLRDAGAEEIVRQLVDSVPPLTIEMRTRLAAILTGGEQSERADGVA
jgi:hypothetical protein